MKNLLLFGVVGLVLLGAGCAEEPRGPVETVGDGTSVIADEKVEGAWHLTFDLPKDWVMVPQYDEDEEVDPTVNKVNNQMTDVVLQSTNKPIDLTGASDLPSDQMVTDDYLYIRTFRMSKSSIVPAEAEDMGNGFSRLIKGVTATYYFAGEFATYKFVVYWDERELSEAEKVITSAKEVTDFTTE